jgi:hypothetical protein
MKHQSQRNEAANRRDKVNRLVNEASRSFLVSAQQNPSIQGTHRCHRLEIFGNYSRDNINCISEELHADVDIAEKRELMTAPFSEHYVKATSVDSSEISLQMSFKNLNRSGFSNHYHSGCCSCRKCCFLS